MKTIRGYIYNTSSNAPIENVAILDSEPGTNSNPIVELSNSRGEFTITVGDNVRELYFYKVGTGSTSEGLSSFFIPVPTPSVWNVGLLEYTFPELVIRPDKEEKKIKLWPVYAGLGLLALILITRKKKRRK
jgi:hypothetical protein